MTAAGGSGNGQELLPVESIPAFDIRRHNRAAQQQAVGHLVFIPVGANIRRFQDFIRRKKQTFGFRRFAGGKIIRRAESLLLPILLDSFFPFPAQALLPLLLFPAQTLPFFFLFPAQTRLPLFLILFHDKRAVLLFPIKQQRGQMAAANAHAALGTITIIIFGKQFPAAAMIRCAGKIRP